MFGFGVWTILIFYAVVAGLAMVNEEERRMKRLFVSVLILLFTVGLFVGTVNFGKAAPITVTKTFSSLTCDGCIWAGGLTYLTVRNSLTGSRDLTTTIRVGQDYLGTTYYVYRGFLFFDTSTIPHGVNITNAILSINIYGNDTASDFNVTIQNGQPTYPHIPLVIGDYNKAYYSGDGGSRNTSEISVLNYWNITLNPSGVGWLNLDGTTKLCLRSSNDINAVVPTGNEYITFYSADMGEAYAPKLYVTYEAEGYHYILHGAYNEQGISAGAINCTLYKATESSETFLLNGTYDIYTEAIPKAFYFDLGYNKSRVYYVHDTFEEIYVFRPDEPYFTYYVTMRDFVGASKGGWLESIINVNGTDRVVERWSADVLPKLPFACTYGHVYTLKLTTSEGAVYVFGDYAMTDQTDITLTVNGLQFPQDIILTYQYLRIYGTRELASPNGSITITYLDTLNMTVSVAYQIRYNNGSIAYSNTLYVSSFADTWTNAMNDTDYYITATMNHAQFGTLAWKQYLPRGFSNPPWSLDFLGTWPFVSSAFIPAFLIIFVFGCFSVLNAYVGAFFGTVTAALEAYWGWINIPAGMLVAAFGFTVLLGITYAKRRLLT